MTACDIKSQNASKHSFSAFSNVLSAYKIFEKKEE
jgi:hypothetical protein